MLKRRQDRDWWLHLPGPEQSQKFFGGDERKGFILIENNVKLYSTRFPEIEKNLHDIIFCPPPLNCYFLAVETKLYRKDINEKTPYPIMSLEFRSRSGVYLRY